jgi:ethanolamine utilization protein EutP
MVIGPVAAGKSTLLAALGLGPRYISKTQALTYNKGLSIDTPGEMLAIPRFYNALILNSSRASLVLLVMDGQKPRWLPAKITSALKAKVIGVVSKIDLAEEDLIKKAERALINAGVTAIYKVSTLTGAGLSLLRESLINDYGLDLPQPDLFNETD